MGKSLNARKVEAKKLVKYAFKYMTEPPDVEVAVGIVPLSYGTVYPMLPLYKDIGDYVIEFLSSKHISTYRLPPAQLGAGGEYSRLLEFIIENKDFIIATVKWVPGLVSAGKRIYEYIQRRNHKKLMRQFCSKKPFVYISLDAIVSINGDEKSGDQKEALSSIAVLLPLLHRSITDHYPHLEFGYCLNGSIEDQDTFCAIELKGSNVNEKTIDKIVDKLNKKLLSDNSSLLVGFKKRFFVKYLSFSAHDYPSSPVLAPSWVD